jgi:hypothetical protein
MTGPESTRWSQPTFVPALSARAPAPAEAGAAAAKAAIRLAAGSAMRIILFGNDDEWLLTL